MLSLKLYVHQAKPPLNVHQTKATKTKSVIKSKSSNSHVTEGNNAFFNQVSKKLCMMI